MLVLVDSLIFITALCATSMVSCTSAQQQPQYATDDDDVSRSQVEDRISVENHGTTTTPIKPNRALDYQRFLYYWKLHHEMRFDFERIMDPCKNDTKWASYYYDRTPFLITSANLSGVELDIKPAGQYSRIVIKSYSLKNTPKTVGGDSWRVLIKGVRSITPLVMDNMDGTYEASFLVTEPGFYHVILSLEYTLCDGLKDPPPHWFNKGDFFFKILKYLFKYLF